ncbi:MAG TPA: aconitate hydratase, partial [Anaerolineaceae bacterium]
AEAAMLGQPNYFLTPDVVGVHLTGSLREGVTATDLVLVLTELLRKAKVVGKFVEYHGEGARTLPAVTRATIANMAPEYGATMGFFPVDEQTLRYYAATGRSAEQVETIRAYLTAQGLFGIPRGGELDYSTVLELDLGSVTPSVAGPKRPQDRIALGELSEKFGALLTARADRGGFGRAPAELGRRFGVTAGANGAAQPGGGSQDPGSTPALKVVRNTNPLTELEMMNNRPTPDQPASALGRTARDEEIRLGHGSVVIAAITSCTNTSNPSVMLAAGLLAKKAVERGLTVNPTVKTSLAPGSRVVSEYLEKAGLQPYLDQLGFNVVGYGCTTCIGNSGPLDEDVSQAIAATNLVAAAVLSGNRNFEGRINPQTQANYLASPPLVVAYALAGTVDLDLENEPLGTGKDGKPVYLRDIWPSSQEVLDTVAGSVDPEMFRSRYADVLTGNQTWNEIQSGDAKSYTWKEDSTYIQEPPYFTGLTNEPPKTVADIRGARVLAVLGDSITTDHISPAGAIPSNSAAGRYLVEHGVQPKDFNSFGSRRGNDRVMTRGTFGNIRLKNQLVPGVEGSFTRHLPDGEQMTIFDAAMKYKEEGIPLVVLAGKEYGTGSSRDWAAKGPFLLGVRAVIAESFERIHRSNLVGMGVLPLQYKAGENAKTLGLTGNEVFDIQGLAGRSAPGGEVTVNYKREDGRTGCFQALVRIDTKIELEYYRNGGIMQTVLYQMLKA